MLRVRTPVHVPPEQIPPFFPEGGQPNTAHHFHSTHAYHQYSITSKPGEMDLRINDRIILQAGRFNALIAPLELVLGGINGNPVIGRYTTLLIGGNFSRLLNGITRTSGNFEIRRSFTVHQLLTILREDDHSIVIVEHDPTIYEDAGDAKRVVPPTMKDLARDVLFVLYAPTMDPSFAYLAHTADHLWYYDDGSAPADPGPGNYAVSRARKAGIPGQKTLF